MRRNYTNDRNRRPRYNAPHGDRWTIKRQHCKGRLTCGYVVYTPGTAYAWVCASRRDAVALAGKKMVNGMWYPVLLRERVTSIKNFRGYPWTCEEGVAA